MITPKSFRLEWKPLYNTISLDLRVYYGYRIQYTVSRTTEWVTYDVPFNRSHFVMTDLQDNSTYDCKIVPFRNTANGFDTGISLNATLSTLGCPRPSPVKDVNFSPVRVTNSNQWLISLSWKLPQNTDCNTISLTRVSYYMADIDNEMSKYINETSIDFPLTSPGIYQIELQVVSVQNRTSEIVYKQLNVATYLSMF
ncbi:hypothetical protein LSH36_13g23025 [Paralvinella palmiformis]|uniref:Fibronectin type-III domain-containing protein n=1 Tax=Paralvinella palmiformis TaxID=53620 RepID=A0AAD9KDZ1_9ANNE|nr:hypothetical protein LSH36_13g23025 [Paralvinella palmiformis]